MYSLTEEQAEWYYGEGGGDDCEFEVVEGADEWDDQGKYQYSSVILEHKETGKFYTFEVQRSGSYFTDYFYSYYSIDKLQEVHQVEVTTTALVWAPVS